jgi:hypothetical protein
LVTFLRAVAREASADGVSPAAADGRTAALRVLLVSVIGTAVWSGAFRWRRLHVPVDGSAISG